MVRVGRTKWRNLLLLLLLLTFVMSPGCISSSADSTSESILA